MACDPCKANTFSVAVGASDRTACQSCSRETNSDESSDASDSSYCGGGTIRLVKARRHPGRIWCRTASESETEGETESEDW